MRPFRRLLSMGLVVGVVSGSFWGMPRQANAQTEATTTYAGVAFSIELPEGWAGKSVYMSGFGGGLAELAFMMPSGVPDLPTGLDENKPLDSLIEQIGLMDRPGEWIEALTTQPVFWVLFSDEGGDTVLFDTADLAESIVADEDDAVLTEGPDALTVDGMDGLSGTGSMVGAHKLKGYTFQFHAALFAVPGQTIALGGFATEALFSDYQATFETMVQSFKRTTAPPIEFTPLTDTATYQNDTYTMQYPSDWVFQFEEEGTFFTNAAIPAGQTYDTINEIALKEPTNGEVIATFFYLPADGDRLKDITNPTSQTVMRYFLAGLLPATLKYHQWEGSLIIEAQLRSPTPYAFSFYVMPRGDDFVFMYLIYPPNQPVEPDILYTMLTSATGQ